MKNKENGGHVAFNPMGGYMMFTGSAKTGSTFSHDDMKKGGAKFETDEMFTIGTPLPKGRCVGARLDAWICEQQGG